MSLHDQQPPWGKKKKPQTPEDLVAQLIKKLQDFFSESPKRPPGDSGNSEQPSGPPLNPLAAIGKIFAIATVLLIGFGVLSSFYKIAPSEVGVILRLGKYSATQSPGLHFKIPYIDKLYKVNVE